MKNIILIVAILLSCQFNLFGTHNLAGEIQYTQIAAKSIETTIITYTTPEAIADRAELELCMGDGT